MQRGASICGPWAARPIESKHVLIQKVNEPVGIGRLLNEQATVGRSMAQPRPVLGQCQRRFERTRRPCCGV